MGSERTRHLFANGRPVVIPFFTAGFPNRRVFLDAVMSSQESGAAAIEIGMPFSDPLADGPAIQHSSQTVLDHGLTMSDVLDLTASLRARMTLPIFLMGYLNPVMRRGLEQFARAAQQAGADGTIIPDCPMEEARDWLHASRQAKLDNVFLIAPTSPEDRIRRIDRMSTRFSYCVSVAGVTGARRDIAESTRNYLRRVRRIVRKPYVVGFGISRPEHIRSLAGLADGFVVGSALVPLLDGARRSDAASKVARLVAALVRAAESTTV